LPRPPYSFYVGYKKFADLGSGDGRVAILAAKHGLKASGIEKDGRLIRTAQAMETNIRKEVPLSDIEWIHGDIFEQDLSEYDILFYTLNGTLLEQRLRKQLLRQIKPDALLVLYDPSRREMPYKFDGFRLVKPLRLIEHHASVYHRAEVTIQVEDAEPRESETRVTINILGRHTDILKELISEDSLRHVSASTIGDILSDLWMQNDALRDVFDNRMATFVAQLKIMINDFEINELYTFMSANPDVAKSIPNMCFRNYVDFRGLKMQSVLVAILNNQFFSSTTINPSI